MHLKERSGELIVTFDKRNDMLHCIIEDNGIGRKRSQELRDVARHEPMGLSITHERIEILNDIYRTHIQVTITDKTNVDGSSAGTMVEVVMPLNLNKNSYA
jgi:sensor histidine kinase YesM